VEACLHLQRAQPKFAEGKDCLTVSYTRIAWITEGVPQHPKKHTIGLSDKARSTEECCPKRQLVNKERDDCSFRVPGLLLLLPGKRREEKNQPCKLQRQLRVK